MTSVVHNLEVFFAVASKLGEVEDLLAHFSVTILIRDMPDFRLESINVLEYFEKLQNLERYGQVRVFVLPAKQQYVNVCVPRLFDVWKCFVGSRLQLLAESL